MTTMVTKSQRLAIRARAMINRSGKGTTLSRADVVDV